MKHILVYTALFSACFMGTASAEIVKTKGVGYACTKIVDLAKVKKAQRTGNGEQVSRLMKSGCFATLPRWNLKKVNEWGLAVQVEGTPKDFGFHNTPGMEKISKIQVWMHKENIR